MLPKKLPAIIGVLVLAAASVAAPKITGDVEVRPGGFAQLTIDGTNKTVLWTITPEPTQEAEIFGTLVFTGESGKTYTATAVVIDFEAKTATKLKHTVRFGGTPPIPDPPKPDPPKPDPPKPDPPPVAGKLFIVVVEETKQAAADRGVWFTDRELWAYFRDKGHRLRIVDQDVKDGDGNTPKDVKRFIDDAKKETLPRLYLVGDDGKTRRAGPMPKSAAELIAELKKYGG